MIKALTILVMISCSLQQTKPDTSQLLVKPFVSPLPVKTVDSSYAIWKQCDQLNYARTNIFQVTGTGTSVLKPTVGIVVLGISVTSKVAVDALQKANSQLNAAISAIQSAVSPSSGRTPLKTSVIPSLTTFSSSQLSIQPNYVSSQDPKTQIYSTSQVGYTVTNLLTIRAKDLTLIGTIIDQGVASGLNNVQSITFSLESQELISLKESLITQAVQDAITKAKSTLAQVGLIILSVKAVNIIDQQPTPQFYPMGASNVFMSRESVAPTQVFAGDLTVNQQVSLSFVVGKDKSTASCLLTNTCQNGN